MLEVVGAQGRRRLLLLVGLMVAAGCSEVLGVGSVLPFMTFVANPEKLELLRGQGLPSVLNALSRSEFLLLLGVVVILAMTITNLISAFVAYAGLRFAAWSGHSLATRLLASYLSRPYSWMLHVNSANLGRNVLVEVNAAVNSFLLPLTTLMARVAVTGAIFCLLLVADIRVALSVTLVVCSVFGLFYLFLRRRMDVWAALRAQADLAKFRAAIEAFGSPKEVRILQCEPFFLHQFEVASHLASDLQARTLMAASLPRYILETLVFGAMVTMVVVLLVRDEGLQRALPMISLYAVAAVRLMPAVQQAYGALTIMRYHREAVVTLYRDLEEAKAYPVASDANKSRINLETSVEFDRVTFRYEGSHEDVLSDVCFKILKGEKVGIIGPTGAGKTTLVDLLLGLLIPTSGQILVDGCPLKADNANSWQLNVGYVPQDIYLLDDTIASNIAFGDRDISWERVRQAAEVANISEFIEKELPQRYATIVGERGVRLSGGQRQRIGIARAVYRDPEFLVLDEATSALDGATEEGVMQAVNNLSKSMTVVIIAHRLTTVQDCDRILDFERGRLIRTGSYSELFLRAATQIDAVGK